LLRFADGRGGGLRGRRDPHLSRVRGLLAAPSHAPAGHRGAGHHTLPDQGPLGPHACTGLCILYRAFSQVQLITLTMGPLGLGLAVHKYIHN